MSDREAREALNEAACAFANEDDVGDAGRRGISEATRDFIAEKMRELKEMASAKDYEHLSMVMDDHVSGRYAILHFMYEVAKFSTMKNPAWTSPEAYAECPACGDRGDAAHIASCCERLFQTMEGDE